MIPELVHTLEATVTFMEQSVTDLSEQQMVEQPTGAPNHPMWTLGHIICSCQGIAAELGADHWLPDDWESNYGYGSMPLSDRSRYPRKPEMLALLADATSRLSRTLLAANESVLDRSLPDKASLSWTARCRTRISRQWGISWSR
jgi:hypothetical protein